MKPGSTLFFQGVMVLVGAGALAFLLGEPHLEGRNVHATFFEIYFKDPFLAYVYAGSTPFFLALYHAFGLFGQVRKTGAFSPATLAALQTIKRCAIVLMGFVAVGMVIILARGDPDDRPAGFFMGFLVAGVAGLMAIGATKFSRTLETKLKQPADRER